MHAHCLFALCIKHRALVIIRLCAFIFRVYLVVFPVFLSLTNRSLFMYYAPTVVDKYRECVESSKFCALWNEQVLLLDFSRLPISFFISFIQTDRGATVRSATDIGHSIQNQTLGGCWSLYCTGTQSICISTMNMVWQFQGSVVFFTLLI